MLATRRVLKVGPGAALARYLDILLQAFVELDGEGTSRQSKARASEGHLGVGRASAKEWTPTELGQGQILVCKCQTAFFTSVLLPHPDVQ